MDSVLITGGSGFVGLKLASLLKGNYSVYIACKTYDDSLLRFGEYVSLDIRDANEVRRIVTEIRPTAVVHAAALTNVNDCARYREKAFAINVTGTENVSRSAEEVNARVVYLSTDLVFDGKQSFYTEEDEPNPVCYYGVTKLHGEHIIASLNSNYCIARPGLIFGKSIGSSTCFAETMADRLQKHQEIRLFNDEFRTPVYLDNVCALIGELLARNELRGIYHLCGSERISRYDFGLKLAGIFGLDPSCIVASSLQEYPFADVRPADCSMNNQKAFTTLNTKAMTIDEGLYDMAEKITFKP